MNFDLYDFYKDMKSKEIIFCYSGPVAQISLEGTARALRRNLELESTSNNATHAIFSVFIEMMQNVLNYSAERPPINPDPDHALSMGVVVVGQNGEGYFIYCGNRISNKDIAPIRNYIEEIRLLSKEELKNLYKVKRRQAFEPGAKGAGLGLLEMARKAGKPLDYAFTPIDEEWSFFNLKVQICREVGR